MARSVFAYILMCNPKDLPQQLRIHLVSLCRGVRVISPLVGYEKVVQILIEKDRFKVTHVRLGVEQVTVTRTTESSERHALPSLAGTRHSWHEVLGIKPKEKRVP